MYDPTVGSTVPVTAGQFAAAATDALFGLGLVVFVLAALLVIAFVGPVR